MAEKIRVGLVGYGYAGKTFHAPLIAGTPGLELAAVSSSDAGKVHADWPSMTVVGGAQALFADPALDLIVIPTPNDTHFPLAQQALAAGKHVVVDKPFTVTLSQAQALQQQAQQSGLLLSVFHNRRWDSDFLGVKQVIEQGLIGKVTHFESHIDRYRPEVRVRWREQNLPGSGLWFDLGPHMVDQALQLFGLPHSVQANIATLRPNAQINDWAHVVLNYPTHRVILHGSMLVAGGVSRFTVHGEKGSVVKARADGQESQLLAGVTPGSAEWGKDDDAMSLFIGTEPVRTLPTPDGDQRQYYVQVRDALRGAGSNPVTAPQALAVMAVLEAATLAAETGVTQSLPLTEAEIAAW